MADAKTRLYSLPEITEINSDMYLMLDASATGVRKYNLKTMYDKVDGVQASADAANTAATAAAAAVDSANQAAQQAASAAESATTTVQGLVEDVNEAIEAVGDVTELAVPTMSPTVKGGAKLGTGLEVVNDTLSVNTTASGDGSQAGPILSLSANGWAEQSTTTGKNLLSLGNVGSEVSIVGDRVTNTVADTGRHFFRVRIMYYNGDTATSAYSTYDVNSVGKFTWQFTVPSGITLTHALFKHNGANADIRIGFVYGLAAGSTYTLSMDVIGYDAGTVGGLVLENIQVELGSTATAYEPYTGGSPSPSPDYPQEIRVCSGRNLLNPALLEQSIYRANVDGSITVLSSDNRAWDNLRPVATLKSGKYTITRSNASGTLEVKDSSGATKTWVASGTPFATFEITQETAIRFRFGSGASSYPFTAEIQLERGSVAHPYVPYGYVGMDVYDGGTHVSTTPIPLPSRGWVASLPDGTADTLTLDGAGKVTWEERCNEKKFSELSWSVAHNYSINRFDTTIADKRKPSSGDVRASDLMSDCYIADGAGAIAGNVDHRISGYQNVTELYVTDSDYSDVQAFLSARGNATVLYPLATTVTEELGYIEMPEIPVGAEISIPELDDLGVRYCVDDAASELARMWYEKAKSEYAEELMELRVTVNELATRIN